MMEKICHSSTTRPSAAAAAATTTTTTTTSSTNPTTSSSSVTTAANSGNTIQSSLKSLNKSSYKISKPASGNRNPNPNPSPARTAQPPPQAAISGGDGGGAPPQPPVYNIDKDDFREVVQKLTGSPANHQVRPAAPSPPPPAAPVVPTSRLHRIRPPPLVHLAQQRPAPSLPSGEPWTRPPFSPLPPLPAVNTAAESPISAYMRRLHSGGQSPTAAAVTQPTTAPLGFGCLPSPRTAYEMMMSAGMGLPTSPGVPMPTASPR